MSAIGSPGYFWLQTQRIGVEDRKTILYIEGNKASKNIFFLDLKMVNLV